MSRTFSIKIPIAQWDISPDGKRFLMIGAMIPAGTGSEPGTPAKINIVLNWTEELKQRAPLK